MTVIATVEIDLRIVDDSYWEDELNEFLKVLESGKILSKEVLTFGTIKCKILKEFEFNSFRDFVFDLEDKIEKKTFSETVLYFTNIEGYRIRDVIFKP